jgi:hypothetical protein
VAEQISKIPGIVDAFDGVSESNPTIRVTPKPSAALTVDELSDGFAAAVGGIVATSIASAGGTIPVRVGLAEPAAATALADLALPTRDGLQPLGRLATIGEPERASQVEERNGGRRLLITAGIEGANLSAVIPRIQAIVAALHLPPGYRIAIGGAYRQQQDSFREFASVLGVALVLVFLVLLATFNSFRVPLVILATIPLSPIGVLLALWLTGTPINVASFMGLLLLVGIVVRNGILLIDAANRRRREGAGVGDALLDAGAERLRPILMTTFAAIGALLPLALGLGSGSEMLRPLAVAVIGGLATATAFTLVLIPVLYAAVAGGPAASLSEGVRARLARSGAVRIDRRRAIIAAAIVLAAALGIAYELGAFRKQLPPGEYAEGSPEDLALDWFEARDRGHVGYLAAADVVGYELRLFRRIDADHDGRVSLEEFVAGVPPDQAAYVSAFRSRFAAMDEKHQGSVGPAEVEAYFRALLRRIDKNGDGKVTEKEWFAGTVGDKDWFPASVSP